MKKRFFSIFPALKHKSFRLYFVGQAISLSGTWLQIVAQGWLVLELTHSAFWVGLVSGLGSLPFLLVTPFSGLLLDRFPRKKVLLAVQIAGSILALILGTLVLSGSINVLEVAILAFLMGVCAAIDIPARQSFMIEMVGREDVSSAVTLQTSTANLGRIAGPLIAGLLIASVGIGWTFIANSLSYSGLTAMLILMKTIKPILHPRTHPVRAFLKGLSYALSHQTIRILLIVNIFAWTFIFSYAAILPFITKVVFHQDATVLGSLYAASGVGGIFAAIAVSVLAKKINRLVFIIGGNLLAVFSLFVFSFNTNLLYAHLLLFFVGLGLVASLALANGTIQYLVEDSVRGRVTGLYIAAGLGASAFGDFQIGYVAELFGSQFAIRLGAVIMAVFLFFLWLKGRKYLTSLPMRSKESAVI